MEKILYPDLALLQILASKITPCQRICVSSSQFCHFYKDRLQKLVHLDLSNCNLSTFPYSLAKTLGNVKLLDLSGNKFKYIPQALHILAKYGQNPTIILSDNGIDFSSPHAKRQLQSLSDAGVDFILDSLIDFAPSEEDSI
jgi:hypothetical protein